MFIYRYVVIILTFASMTFVHVGPIRSLSDEITGDQTKRVETLKGKFWSTLGILYNTLLENKW